MEKKFKYIQIFSHLFRPQILYKSQTHPKRKKEYRPMGDPTDWVSIWLEILQMQLLGTEGTWGSYTPQESVLLNNLPEIPFQHKEPAFATKTNLIFTAN